MLDEIGDSSARMQGLLLRFLQFGELQRIGEYGSARHVDVRVVATTRRDLLEQVSAGEFRLDLYYRLNVIRIHVPPLRDRVEDIPELVDHFATRFSEHYQMPCPVIDREAMAWLTSYSWPGNVRELRNLVERFVITGKAGGLDPAWLADEVVVRASMETTRPSKAGLRFQDLAAAQLPIELQRLADDRDRFLRAQAGPR